MNWHFKCGRLSGCVILISALLSACNREVKTDEFKNTTYTLEEEYIKVDADTGIRYVDNVLLVYFEPGIEDSDKKDIIHSVGGKIVGFYPSMDYYQIEIEESDLETLKKTSRQLMEHDEVMFVSYDMVNEMSGSSPGGYSVEKGVINDEIERNSWWREAIELESAWEYEEYFSEIDVGIIDGFFDDEHPNLDLTVLNEENNNEGKKADSSTGELNHGTSVAGVIGAKRSNGIQIRGVAENADLYCYSFAYVVKMPDNGGRKNKI